MALREINFDGIVGPSHNYAGLSLGNLASTRNAGQVSQPRAAALQVLSEIANGYLTVLKNNTWHEEAAYNYEYVIRLRDEVAKGRRLPPDAPPSDMELGSRGAPSDATSTKGFQIYVPLQGDEKSPEGGDAAKATEKTRKG